MKDLWSEEHKFHTYLAVEIANCEALHDMGLISSEELSLIQSNAQFDVHRIAALEEELHHDVIAFTRCVSESLGAERRWIHYGLTSTDVVDTAYGLRLKEVNEVLEKDLRDFMEVLKHQAFRYQKTLCIGRTHGIHADITTFGLKWALWYDEMNRQLARFLHVRNEIEVGKLSGAVGNYAFLDPRIETYVMKSLGLGRVNISTQTLQRDRHAHYIQTIALIGATLEKIATEIRHLQRTEVREVLEPFAKNQKGSSAMPHKKNPIQSENICGLARVLRGYTIPALDDVSLWHERDISHSSVERIILPDATILLDSMLTKYAKTLSNLVVDEARMLENIDQTRGQVFAQAALDGLLKKSWTREEAYDLVQSVALSSWENKLDFRDEFVRHPKIQNMFTLEDLATLFAMDRYLAHIDEIYSRVF
ncbi:MAG: adenylosuccinate lyase [Candidatus Izemoplasmatales bacterium]|nr:adenylosuccinate lyase [Candidatus Izemoplasmatales bacterium]